MEHTEAANAVQTKALQGSIQEAEGNVVGAVTGAIEQQTEDMQEKFGKMLDDKLAPIKKHLGMDHGLTDKAAIHTHEKAKYMMQGGIMVNAQADMVQERADKQQKRADDKALKVAKNETDDNMEAARKAQDTANRSKQCVTDLREKAEAMKNGRPCKKVKKDTKEMENTFEELIEH